MHLAARFDDAPLISFEVEVEMGERVLLDVAGRVAQRLEFRQPVGSLARRAMKFTSATCQRRLQLASASAAWAFSLKLR